VTVEQRIDLTGAIVESFRYEDPFPDGSGGYDAIEIVLRLPDGRRIVLYPAWHNDGTSSIGVDDEESS
jgi:hypothetical protein